GWADLVVVHQVLHYLGDPAAAVREAARITAPDGRLIIVDFAPHGHEYLREEHQHRRLGFSDGEMGRWLAEAELPQVAQMELPPTGAAGPTVRRWAAPGAPTAWGGAAGPRQRPAGGRWRAPGGAAARGQASRSNSRRPRPPRRRR